MNSVSLNAASVAAKSTYLPAGIYLVGPLTVPLASRVFGENPGGEIATFFKAKARKNPIRIARTLVALELARIVYHVLSKQEDFNGQFKGQALSHRKHAKWPRRASPPV